MSTLITGGTGQIGSYLVRKLVSEGERVIAYDVAPQTESIKDIADKVTVARGDLTDPYELTRAMKDFSVEQVVHMGGVMTAESRKRPWFSTNINLGGTLNTLEACRLLDVKRMVFSSSIAVYGFTENKPIDEDYPKNPCTLYGVHKLASEFLGLNYCEAYGVDFRAVRYASVYGPGKVRGLGVFLELVDKPLKGLQGKIEQGGDQKYEPVYVEDAVNGTYLALTAKAPKHRIFNIGTGELWSLHDILGVVRSFLPKASVEIGPGYDNAYPVRGPLRLNRAREELGYEPQYSMKEGLAAYIRALSPGSVPSPSR